MPVSSTSSLRIKKISPEGISESEDLLAVEEPLEISVLYSEAQVRTEKNISVTMRTPGNDAELALGFLFTEGIIMSRDAVKDVKQRDFTGNKILVELGEHVSLELKKLERNFYTTSSCGVCGKTSIEAIRTLKNKDAESESFQFESGLITQLPEVLRKQQEIFKRTGGLHASALFNRNGEILFLREDVGRHNALDKLIGYALQENLFPLDKHILLLSGRASFELIQKAAMAGIKVIAAVGAPSSLAVQLAQEFRMTLIGFLRGERFNIYCGEERVKV